MKRVDDDDDSIACLLNTKKNVRTFISTKLAQIEFELIHNALRKIRQKCRTFCKQNWFNWANQINSHILRSFHLDNILHKLNELLADVRGAIKRTKERERGEWIQKRINVGFSTTQAYIAHRHHTQSLKSWYGFVLSCLFVWINFNFKQRHTALSLSKCVDNLNERALIWI